MSTEVVALIALSGATLTLILARSLGLDSLSWGTRLALWAVAGAALLVLAVDRGSLVATMGSIGLAEPGRRSLLWGLAGAIGLMATGGAVLAIQRLLGVSAGDQDTFARVAALPLAHRLFIILTAAVVEEILFRGVPLTVGPPILGGLAPAAIMAVAAFVLAHFRWKPIHLIQVAVAGAGLCVLFVLSGGDLWACIVAHLIIDAVGFLMVPMILRLKGKTAIG